MIGFKEKVVIITGASSGIGEALAREFAALGANVVIAARNEAKLGELADSIAAQGGTVLAVKCDVSSQADFWLPDFKRWVKTGMKVTEIAPVTSRVNIASGIEKAAV